MTGTEPFQGGASTSSAGSLVEEIIRLVEENRRLSAMNLSLGITVSDLINREEITRDETERRIFELERRISDLNSELNNREEITRDETERRIFELETRIANLNIELGQAWSLEQHLLSLIDSLNAQIQRLQPVQPINEALGWGRIRNRPAYLDLPTHENQEPEPEEPDPEL
jgi:polyhydroxyalkanoate synthesis regulator phasin